MRKIDSYAHILPKAYFDRMAEIAKDQGAIKRWLTIPVLHDLDARLKMTADGDPLALRWSEPEVVHDSRSLRVRARRPGAAAPSVITVEAVLFPTIRATRPSSTSTRMIY